jgi:phage terminase large subunit GpA-like protein
MADAALIYRQAFREGLLPPAAMTVSEWADEHRMLSSKGSSEPGQWRTDRTPYLREPMDCLSPSNPTRRVVLMFGSQLGKTEVVLNWLGAIIHLWPGPTLLVQPTLDLAKRYSKQRIASLIESTPALRDRVLPARMRDSGNTLLEKEFDGGILIIAGANSAAGLR